MWLLRVLRIVAILTPLLPASIGYALCKMAGLLFYTFNFRARRNVLANMQHVDPEMTWIKRQITALRTCTTVVTNYYDLLRLRSVDRHDALNQIDIHGLEHIEHALSRGQGAIVVSGHIGNFSVMTKLPALFNFRSALIAERVEPPPLYHYMARLRAAMGVDVLSPEPASLRRIFDLLKDNGLLLLAADRDVTRQGRTVRFFDTETTLPAGPVLLAMRTGAPLIPAFTLRQSGNRSRVMIDQPLQIRNSGNWETDLAHNLRTLARHLEQMINADPGQWAVLQRVWPPTSEYGRSEGLGSADEAVISDETTAEQPTNHRESA